MPETASEATYRWSRDAYDRAVEAGVFGPDDRLEPIDGQLLAMTPQGSRHAAMVRDRIAPLARPGVEVAVTDLLP